MKLYTVILFFRDAWFFANNMHAKPYNKIQHKILTFYERISYELFWKMFVKFKFRISFVYFQLFVHGRMTIFFHHNLMRSHILRIFKMKREWLPFELIKLNEGRTTQRLLLLIFIWKMAQFLFIPRVIYSSLRREILRGVCARLII